MTYKLFVWKVDDKFVAVFPEIDAGDITIGEDKDAVKIQAKVKARNTLKGLDTLPENRSLEELEDFATALPDNDLISVGGIALDEL
jgi:hypothetical protein